LSRIPFVVPFVVPFFREDMLTARCTSMEKDVSGGDTVIDTQSRRKQVPLLYRPVRGPETKAG
jgi:hypothetical protein